MTQSLPKLRGNRPGVVAALFTILLFIASCGGSSKNAMPTPIFSPGAGSYSTTQNVTVSDINKNAVLYCTNDGSTPTASSPQCANPIKVSQSQTLSAIAIAPGMASSAVATAQYTIAGSTVAPTITGIGPATGSSSGGTSVTIVGTNFIGVTAVNFGTNQAVKFTVNSATSITAVSPAGVGSVHITVIAAGGTSATTTADVFSYGTAPSITGLSPASATVGSAAITLAVSGGNFTSDAVVEWNGAPLTTTFTSSTQLTATVPASLLAAAGSATVTVKESGGASAGVSFAINAAAPSIVGISPSQGPIAGGTTVTITGSNFTGVSAVKFGAAAATSFTVVSANSITAVSPGGSAGPVDIQVVTPSGQSATGSNDQFTYLAPPTVTVVSPSTGKLAGGTTVTISGFNLTGATSVSFGSTAAAGFQVISATSITAVSPGGSAGPVDIRVTTSGGESAISGADQFTFTSTPVVIGVTPSAGPLAGGTAVTIKGENFVSGATTVYFNGNPATNVSASADGLTISATSPAGSAGTVDITVATSGGTSTTSSADHFTYAPAPTVTEISPATGSTDGGTAVTIKGTNFSGTDYTVTAVNFGSTAVTPDSVSAGSITATSPAGSAGPVNVTVVTPGGSATSAIQFTYAPPPAVNTIDPSSGPTTGGTSVTIKGTGFTGATEVDFGSNAVTPGSGSVSPDGQNITVTTPAASSVGAVDVTVKTPIGTGTLTGGFTYDLAISGTVKDGGTPISGSIVTLYAAGTLSYGASPTKIATAANPTNSTGAFTIPPLTAGDCPAAPGDLFYLVATGSNAGKGTNGQIALMAALGSCNSSTFPTTVTMNEVTTVASAYVLAGFANVDTTNNEDIDIAVGTPTGGSSCKANAGWKSTGASTCNYIGLKNAFALVNNLVDIPTGQALAVTPAYCTSKPCITASATTPYYATSIVPQGRINTLANALAACVDSSGKTDPNLACSNLFTATTITTPPAPNSPIVTIAPGTTITPEDTLQAALNIAHCPGDSSITLCGVDAFGANGILSLVTASSVYQPTLTASDIGATKDLTLAVIYQGAGLGGGAGAVEPEATGLAIDAAGNVWVPTMSNAGGSVAVFDNLGKPITPSGTSPTSLGGYTTGVYNPQSIAIDQNGNAWIGNSPADGNHGLADNGSLSQIKLDPSTLTLSAGLSGLTSTSLLTPAPYGLAIDSTGNPWIASNPGGVNNKDCGSFFGATSGTTGGSLLEFDSGTGNPINTLLKYSDNSSCPAALAVDHNGYLWVSDQGVTGGSDPNTGLLQLDTSSGTVVGGPYNTYLVNNPWGSSGVPAPWWNIAIDGGGNGWLGDSSFNIDAIPNLTGASVSDLSSGTWGVSLLPLPFLAVNGFATGSVAIDGAGNAFASTKGYLIEYPNINVNPPGSSDTTMLSPIDQISYGFLGYSATDPSQNASGRATGGTQFYNGGYAMDGGSLQGAGVSAFGFVGTGMDSSGNLWISSAAVSSSSITPQGSQLTEFVGLAAPTATPLTTGAGLKP